MITQFQGEDRRDAIVNHFSLNLEEEESFFDYLQQLRMSEDTEDHFIEAAHINWRANQQ